ncbi:MAG: PQQ-dependent sugar dehydrogenase, partial [Pirellulales bacterium]
MQFSDSFLRGWLVTGLFAFLLSLSLQSSHCVAQASKANAPAASELSKSPLAVWNSSKILGTPDPPLPYITRQIYADIKLDQPTYLMPVPGTKRMISTQMTKEIVSFSTDGSPDSIQPALDLKQVNPNSARTLSMNFAPNFPDDPYCYVAYTLHKQNEQGTRLSRFKVTDVTLPIIDPSSEEIMIGWPNIGHKGCSIQFDAQGYLYASIGDTANFSPPDESRTGQDVSNIMSSIVRLDVSHAEGDLPYAIPKDNPFVNLEGARPEIWAFGLRNPWRMSFHPKTDELWVGDVGWEAMEMIYRVERGGNYGWSIMEGSQKVHPSEKVGPTPILPAVVEHSHIESRSITGGLFYFGNEFPELQRAYIYGDYVTGKVWALRYEDDKVTWQKEIADTSIQIINFSLASDGEIDILDFGGTVHRLVANTQESQNLEFPTQLSDTGLFQSMSDLQLAPGVLPFEVNAEHWSDHTSSQRIMGLPEDARLNIHAKSIGSIGQIKGDINFPHDTVFAKTVYLEMEAGNPSSKRKIETQVLHRYGDRWNAYNYIWNDEQIDATLADNIPTQRQFIVKDTNAPGGIRKQTWHHSSRNECLLCHIWKAGTIHSFKLPQLDRPLGDQLASIAKLDNNQLQALEKLGLFAIELPKKVAPQISPTDTMAQLSERARAYLHLNCAHCHIRGGGGTVAIDLRQQLTMKETDLLTVQVSQGNFGLDDPKLLLPGNPYRSALYYRVAKMGRGHMPHFGSTEPDAAGIRLIHDWIRKMESEESSKVDNRIAKILKSLKRANATNLEERVHALLASTSDALVLALLIDQGQIPQQQLAPVIHA